MSTPISPAATGPTAGISCDKCKAGEMHATTTARFSSALRFIGYTLLIPCILLLLLTSGCAVISCGAVATTNVEQAERAKAELSSNLAEISGLSEADRNRIVAETDTAERDYLVARLPEAQREPAERAVSMFNASNAGAAIGAGAAGVVGTFFFVAAYVVLIPLLIVGFVLTLKKNVWRCNRCGYIYDRA